MLHAWAVSKNFYTTKRAAQDRNFSICKAASRAKGCLNDASDEEIGRRKKETKGFQFVSFIFNEEIMPRAKL